LKKNKQNKRRKKYSIRKIVDKIMVNKFEKTRKKEKNTTLKNADFWQEKTFCKVVRDNARKR